MRTLFFKYSIVFLTIAILLHTVVYAQEPPSHLFSVSHGLQTPVRIAFDKQDIIYVTDAFQKRLIKYDTTGTFLGTVDAVGLPILVAVSNDNEVIISDNVNGTILKLKADGSTSEIYTECVYPSSAVFDSDDNLYVVDSKLKQVIVLDLSGNVIKTIGNDILVFPTGIAYDQKNNRIIVAEHGGTKSKTGEGLEARILIFNLQGNLINSFGEFGYEDGQFSRIQGVAVDKLGRIYAADPYQATVSVFDENGVFITKLGQFGTEPGQLNAPMDIAIDSHKRIWVTSMNNGSLEVFSIGGIGLENPDDVIPAESDLLQNYPNPFNEGTWIPFVLSNDETLEVNIYDINGAIIRTFNPGMLKKGNYTVRNRAFYWDGTDGNGNPVSTGVYFYELKLNDTRKIQRMVFIKK